MVASMKITYESMINWKRPDDWGEPSRRTRLDRRLVKLVADEIVADSSYNIDIDDARFVLAYTYCDMLVTAAAELLAVTFEEQFDTAMASIERQYFTNTPTYAKIVSSVFLRALGSHLKHVPRSLPENYISDAERLVDSAHVLADASSYHYPPNMPARRKKLDANFEKLYRTNWADIETISTGIYERAKLRATEKIQEFIDRHQDDTTPSCGAVERRNQSKTRRTQ